jgi:hypothetical protein
MMTRYHTRPKATKRLALVADKYLRLTFDKVIRSQIRHLWIRKKVTTDLETLGDIYEKAFEEYLFTEKVPKQVVRIDRETTKLKVSENVSKQVKQLERIAIKRQQPLAVIIEEALQRFLDKPENYLGKGHNVSEHVERLS